MGFSHLPPLDLGTNRTAVSIDAGVGYTTCAILDDSTVKCWGDNSNAQCGQGHTGAILHSNVPPIDVGPEGLLEAPTCSDGVKNGDETGIDCGGDGPVCDACPTCFDGIQNQGETSIDCGGDTSGCSPCCGNGVIDQDEECDDWNSEDLGTADACMPGCVNATCSDGIQNQDEELVDCGGPCEPCCGNNRIDGNEECDDGNQDLGTADSCLPGCVNTTCSDGIQNQEEESVDCGGPCPQGCGNQVDSYTVAVSMEKAGCPASMTTGGDDDGCLSISVTSTGTRPAAGLWALYLSAQPMPFPTACSLGSDKCSCLHGLAATYNATTLGGISDSTTGVCDGTEYSEGGGRVFPALADAIGMYENGNMASKVDGVLVAPLDAPVDGYTITLTASAVRALGAQTAAGTTVKNELYIGFVELLPIPEIDTFDAVPHETKVTLEQTTFATFSSVTAQESSALRFANARVHQVTDPDTLLPVEYYAAISFVVETGSSINAISIPTDSVVVTNGAGGAGMDISCDSSGAFTGTAAHFTESCGPFPGAAASELPFCSGQLHQGNTGLASLYIPLGATTSLQDSLVVEFVMTEPAFEVIAVTINNLGSGGGFVEWCEAGVESTEDLIKEAKLEVEMYAGAVLPGATFPASVTSISDNAIATTTALPLPKPTILDGVITVSVSYEDTAGYSVELVKLAAIYIEDVAGSNPLSNYLTKIPTAAYSPSSGEVVMDTSGLCFDSDKCEVRELVLANELQGNTLDALAVHDTTEEQAGEWMQGVAGTSNPYIKTVGEHFHAELAASSAKAMYLINPRKDTSATALAVGQGISSAVVVFGVWKVNVDSGSRRSSRLLLQTVQPEPGSRGGNQLSSGAVQLQVSAASLAASLLGVSQDHVTVWKIKMGITAAEACLDGAELMHATRARLLLALSNAASGVLDVQITSIHINQDGLECSQLRRVLLGSESPSILVEAMVIFEEGSKPYVDIGALKTAPGIQSVVLAEPSDVLETTEDSDSSAQPPDTAGAEPPTKSSSTPVLLIVAVLAAVLALVFAAAAFLWATWRRGSSAHDLNASILEEVAHGEKHVKTKAGEISVWMGMRTDLLEKGSGTPRDVMDMQKVDR